MSDVYTRAALRFPLGLKPEGPGPNALQLSDIKPTRPQPKERAEMVKLEVPSSSGNAVLLDSLKSRVIGHDEACEELVGAITRHQAGLGSKTRPVGAYLLVGPTGSGKTMIAKALSDLVTGKPDTMIRIDCAEYAASHEVSKLIGAPPGYLGHRETSSLLGASRLAAQTTPGGNQISFVLFDEVDKAHDRFLDLLLGILDAARLTLGDNTVINFSNTLILMTANSGAKEIQDIMRPRHGFAAALPVGADAALKASASGEDAAKKSLRPEFINRLDKILVFHQLTEAEILSVCDLELANLEERCLLGPGIGLTVSADARVHLSHQGYEPLYGARHLKRQIEKLVEKPIAALLTSGQVRRGQVIRIEKMGEELEFYA
jgi:ATP-dependent Clp protease ATP-binding subunit ClpB